MELRVPETTEVGQKVTWSEGLPKSTPPCFHYGGANKVNTAIYSLRDFFGKKGTATSRTNN